ncbi:MAG: COX15/CtaA family protein [Bacteroidota bacterium]
MDFGKNYIRLHWISLVLIYLVVIAGSIVRTSGSGMGCPDWPKCFGQWVPPTNEAQLPENYRDPLLEKRVKKVEKFSRFLSAIGMNETAEKLQKDPHLYEEEPFNARRTWTEYVNRLAGFLAGNVVLLLFIWTILRYRKNKKILFLTGLNAVLMAFQGWFGSIVVASNLVPWTITVHLLVAILIIGIQIYLLRKISVSQAKNISISRSFRILLLVCLVITFGQMFLGTQVREYIDALTRQGFGRETWSEKLGLIFFVHRSFSWLVLILLAILAYINEKSSKDWIFRSAFIVLAIELTSGVVLAYFSLPGWVQVAHLLFASVILGILYLAWLRTSDKSVQPYE